MEPLRVDRNDFISADSLEVLLAEMKEVGSLPTAESILLRALRVLADDENREAVEQLIGLHAQAQQRLRSRPAKGASE